MISRLPDWAWTAAGALAFVAGMVNVVGLLSFKQQALTHLTGSTSLLAVALTSLDGWAVLHFMALLGAFIVGTDLGLALGQALRRVAVDARRVRLCLLIISAFFGGGLAGTAAFAYLGPATLLIPATLTGSTALAYGAYHLNRQRLRKQYA